MVIFGHFDGDFWSFVSHQSSWCLLVFFAHSRPNGYFWSGYFYRSVVFLAGVGILAGPHRISTSWTKIRADLAGYTGPFGRSSEIYVRICIYIYISYTILGRKKK
jgi:hypothetical protein